MKKKPTKKASTKTLEKRFEKAIESLDVEALRELLDEPGAAAIVDAEGLLTLAAITSADEGQTPDKLAIISAMLDKGANINAAGGDYGPLLVNFAAMDWTAPEQRLQWVNDLLARGADPDLVDDRYSALGWAVAQGFQDIIEVLLPRSSEATRLDALNVAISNATSWRDPAKSYPLLDFMLERVSVDHVGRFQLAPVHQAALHGNAEAIRRVLARAKEPQIGLGAEVSFVVNGASPPGGGLVPTVTLAAGLNALEAIGPVLALLETKASAYFEADSEWCRKDRAQRVARFKENAEALRAAGFSEPQAAELKPPAPAFKRALDEALRKLAAKAGGDLDVLQRELDVVDLEGKGPWTYFSAAVQVSHRHFVTGAIDLSGSRLARWLEQDPYRGGPMPDVDVEEDDEAVYRLDVSSYPKEARKPLREGVIVGASDADVYLLWPQKDGTAKVCHAHPEGFWILGETVLDFLLAELAKLA